ncbi:penicillin-binding protein 1C [Candidimonas sp. SYP-B2681]|nr:penicillin-binding protein 1C [Candidimonas sp. SYP-B2681]
MVFPNWTCRLAILLACWASGAAAQPSAEQVKEQYRASDIRVLDRNGQVLDRIRSDFQARRGDWVELGDVSVSLQRAVIYSEDQRFYRHAGVDWKAIIAAGWGNVIHGQHRGASTLSMQLVGLFTKELRRGRSGRSLAQKFDQARQALALEERWSKSQVLEAYLNLVPFRGELIGIGALSHVLFQKHPSGLNARESALAAVLLRGPNASQTALQQRACALLVDMGSPQECDDLRNFIRYTLARRSLPWTDAASLAPHFSRLALAQQNGGLSAGQALPTTLDADLQRFALGSVERHLQALGMANVRDAAIVVLENRTGEVLAYIGSSGGFSDAHQVDHARALRQAGSTLKPFLYAQAIEQQRLTAVSLLNDAPLDLPTGNGLYIPQNYDKRFSGWVSVRTALASSLNIPAVRTLLMVTPDAFARRLVNLGLPLEQTGDFYGYSLALGGADVTLLALTNAYRSFAAAGVHSSVKLVPISGLPQESKPIMSPAATWIVGDILSDRQARARTFGLDSPLSTPFWTAVKTGTSKDMRDNWCLGWSARYTVGVWVGNSAGASMHDVSGVSGAGPIWHDIMTYLHREAASHQSKPPSDVRRTRVDFEGNLEPSRWDYFLGDTMLTLVERSFDPTKSESGAGRIVSPADQTIFALDPDIPYHHQRIRFAAGNVSAISGDLLAWRVDQRLVGRGNAMLWRPMPGRHRIELLDNDGNVLDRISIQVRGAISP